MSSTHEAAASALTNGNALSLFLGAEGFLLAAVALAVNLAAPDQSRPRKLDWAKPGRIMAGALILLGVLAVGAGGTWVGLLRQGAFHSYVGTVVAVALVFAIVGLPLVALFLVLGSLKD